MMGEGPSKALSCILLYFKLESVSSFGVCNPKRIFFCFDWGMIEVWAGYRSGMKWFLWSKEWESLLMKDIHLSSIPTSSGEKKYGSCYLLGDDSLEIYIEDFSYRVFFFSFCTLAKCVSKILIHLCLRDPCYMINILMTKWGEKKNQAWDGKKIA